MGYYMLIALRNESVWCTTALYLLNSSNRLYNRSTATGDAGVTIKTVEKKAVCLIIVDPYVLSGKSHVYCLTLAA